MVINQPPTRHARQGTDRVLRRPLCKNGITAIFNVLTM
jgi:hypothetical protein